MRESGRLDPATMGESRVRKLLALVVALLIAESAAAGPGVGTAEAAGVCYSLGNYHDWVGKNASAIGDGSTYFDRVQGDAYAQNLGLCVGAHNGGTWVLPANVDNNGSTLFQLGYGRGIDYNGGALAFVYTDNSGNPIEVTSTWPGVGNRYRFIIWPNGGMVAYTIDIWNGSGWVFVWGHTTSYTWPTSLTHAWWGYETWDQASSMGPESTSGTVHTAYMGYSGNASGTVYYRSGLAAGDFVTDTNCCSNWHRAVGTWVYGNDVADAWTH